MLTASGLPGAWGGPALHSRPAAEEAVRAMLYLFLIKYLCSFDSKDEFMVVATVFFCFSKNWNVTESHW